MAETSHVQYEENSNVFHRFYSSFKNFNLFNYKQSLSLSEQLFATRLNLLCLLSSLCILVIIRGLAPQSQTNVIISPTLAQFDLLYNQYPSTLVCVCSQINIPYDKILSFTPRYHQICSSDFISQTWISSLFNPNKTDYYPLDFRLSASSQFQIIKLLCQIASQSISDALLQFEMQKMISIDVISRENFQSEFEASIEKLKATTITNVLSMDQSLELNIAYNDLMSSLRSNYFIYGTPGQGGYYTYVAYYLSKNYTSMDDVNDYSCYANYKSAFDSGFYPNRTLNASYYFGPLSLSSYSVPGILAGCLPRFSIMQSTLECFYDFNCLNALQSFGINTSSYQPMNASIPSRFPIDATIQFMFNELFVEDWQNITNFTSYFQICAPMSCSYTYTQQFSILYIITGLLGLLGGLTTAFNLLIPFIVKHIIRRIRRICCGHIHIGQEDLTTNNRTISQIIQHFFHKIREHILDLNVFDKSILLSDMKQKLWATRIYIILLAFGTIILAIYSSIISHTLTVTINNPSRDQFEALYDQYSLTLSCPCTQISVSYATMMSIQPRFHQICSSDFIREDKWLLYFNFIQYNKNLSVLVFYSLDFRLNAGSSIFRIMKVFCEFANETVFNALTTFNNTKFVSNNPLTNESFREQTSALIDQFKQQTLGSFLSLFSLIRAIIEDNQFHTSTDTNVGHVSYFKNNTYYIRLASVRFPNTTDTCLTSNQCTQPQGFFCASIPCYQSHAMNKTIPGLVLSCIPISSLLLSTFECFYNQSCIQMLLDWRLFGYDDIYKPISLNITPLNPNISSQYSPTTKLEDIVSELLIEEWIVRSDVDAHYEHCQPKVCTYTYVTRFKVIYVITIVIGLFGGLSVILRLIIPLLIKILIKQIEKRRQMRITPENQTIDNSNSVIRRQRSILVRLKQSISDVGLFHAQINNSIWATRIYFSLLFIVSIIVLIFTAISRQAQSYTINSPSQSTFETIYANHATDRLSCLCSQSSIQYSTFLSLSVNYHQVCSSDFISPSWWKFIGSRGSQSFYLLDQPLLSNHFRILSSFCSLSQKTVNNSIDSLLANTLISVQALPRRAFEDQIQSTIDILVNETPIKFIHQLDYMIDTCRSNQLEHLFFSNWMLDYSTQMQINNIILTHPRLYNNNTCICATSMSASCFWPMIYPLFNTTIIALPGFVGGCIPVDGLRQSTLECLFDSTCLDNIRLLINNTVAYSMPNPLNESLETRYPYLTTKVDSLIRELFIEGWLNTTNYSAYYETCSPHACSYVDTQYNTFIYTITLLLGLYGGLTVSIRFLVIYTFKMSNMMCHRRLMEHS